jgi:CheY-like chemotaxis protein
MVNAIMTKNYSEWHKPKFVPEFLNCEKNPIIWQHNWIYYNVVNYDTPILNPAQAFTLDKVNKLSHQPKILIIDDEMDIRFLLGNILKQQNIKTIFASTLTDANDIIEHDSELSFVFLDNHLPDGLGVNYIKEVKKKCPACKVIMITAHDNEADRKKASYEGVDFFIAKPFSRELILKTIDKLVN